MARRHGRTFAHGAVLAGAAILGFVAASVLTTAPGQLRERAPIAAVRSLFGKDVGRDAEAPTAIPPAGWWAIVKRTALLTASNRLMAEAAAVTFFALLALFPALTAIVSLYGLVADPAAIQKLVDALTGIVPGGGIDIVRGQLDALIKHGPRGLTLGVGIGLAGALWSSNQGSKALLESLNVIYREEEKRSYPVFVAVAFAFTLAAMVFVVAAMVAVVVLPLLLHALGIRDLTRDLFVWLRWPAILIVVALALSFLYRFGPSRANARWRWVTLGATLAALSWVIVSFGFSWYVQNFGNFDRTYGSLGTLVGFMTWIWISALVALVGAQLDSEMEHQTAADTTTGAPRPLGLRGAEQADSVALR
jgi:membrane protein